MSRAIVGVEIEILSIEGKLKLGQHRSVTDQQGVFDNLSLKGDESQMLAQYMQKISVGIGSIEKS